MAKVNLEMPVQVQVHGLAAVKTLIELIAKYQDQLPEEMQMALVEMLESEEFNALEFTVDDWRDRGLMGEKVETDFKTDNIASVNKILRRVSYFEDGIELDAYPEKFKLGARGHVIIQWGY